MNVCAKIELLQPRPRPREAGIFFRDGVRLRGLALAGAVRVSQAAGKPVGVGRADGAPSVNQASRSARR